MKKIDKDSLLGLWLTGDLDLTDRLDTAPLPHPEATKQ